MFASSWLHREFGGGDLAGGSVDGGLSVACLYSCKVFPLARMSFAAIVRINMDPWFGGRGTAREELGEDVVIYIE